MTVAECSLMSCVWAHFLIGSHIMPGQQHSQPTPTSLAKGCMCVVEWPGSNSFMCHCDNMGVEQTLNKSQHTKLTLEKKFLPSVLLGFELTTFKSRVWCSTNELFWLVLVKGTQVQLIARSCADMSNTPTRPGVSWRQCCYGLPHAVALVHQLVMMQTNPDQQSNIYLPSPLSSP